MAERNLPSNSFSSLNENRDTNLTNFRNFHEEAYLYSDMGIKCDVEGEAEQAVALYDKALKCMDNASSILSSITYSNHSERHKVHGLVEKMEISQKEILDRKNFLIRNDVHAAFAASNSPPSYEESTSPVSELSFGFDNSHLNESSTETVLFCISEGVQIYFIDNNGSVSAPSYPSFLTVYSICKNDHSENVSNNNAYLKVYNWTYPLIKGRSPILKSEFGSYIFPNVSSCESGTSVGVVLPDSLPNEDRELLEDLFAHFTDFRHATSDGSFESVTCKRPLNEINQAIVIREDNERPRRVAQAKQTEKPTSEVIADGLCTGAEYVSKGLVIGAGKAGQLLKKGSEKLCDYIEVSDEPTKVDSTTKKALRHTRTAAGVAVTVSSFIVGALGKATMAVGRELAPHVRKQGVKILPKALKTENEQGRTTLDDIAAVASGGLQGFGTLYCGLEKSAKILAVSVADETVNVVRHKYGDDMGQVTEDGLYAAGGIAFSAYNASALGVKSIAKRAAKDAAIATVHEHHESSSKKKHKSDEDSD